MSDDGSKQLAGYEPRSSLARQAWVGAPVLHVEPGSPADAAGLEAGMLVTHVNGVELRDIITWDWEADGRSVYVEGVAHHGAADEFEFEGTIERDFGQDWGITFDGAVFDGMRLCRNNCTFCFMKMLPKGMRSTLYLRDDDYRLSFLQGNFITLTNMTDADVERVITCALSPLNVSLHAVTPRVRRSLIGRNASRGMEVLERLLEGGIEIHAQVVLVPGVNDGEELEHTLDYVEARPLITSLGIVPLGFTKHQHTFSSSYSTDPQASEAVVRLVGAYQRRSRDKSGRTRYHLADEFYLFSHADPPPARYYDGYPQYYDGIGMVRTFLDDLAAARGDAKLMREVEAAAHALAQRGQRLMYACGTASKDIARRALTDLGLGAVAQVIPVRNDYFGGNVDVSGLLTATDVLAQTPRDLSGRWIMLPDVMFNSDGLTLDGATRRELVAQMESRGGRCLIKPPNPPEMARFALAAAAQK